LNLKLCSPVLRIWVDPRQAPPPWLVSPIGSFDDPWLERSEARPVFFFYNSKSSNIVTMVKYTNIKYYG